MIQKAPHAPLPPGEIRAAQQLQKIFSFSNASCADFGFFWQHVAAHRAKLKQLSSSFFSFF
jgi:hypothetical protein